MGHLYRMLLVCLLIFTFWGERQLLCQPICVTDSLAMANLSKAPALQVNHKRFLASLEKFSIQEVSQRQDAIFYIPVVFHVVHHESVENIPDEQVLSQLQRLNEDFSGQNEDRSLLPDHFKSLAGNSRINFCLANKDPYGAPSSGIVRTPTDVDLIGLRQTNGRRNIFYKDLGGADSWDTEKYLNIYIADLGEIGGYAAIPFTAAHPEEDAVVLNYRFTGTNDDHAFSMGRVGTHEVGHFLGLYHPWGLQEGCQEDDGVLDTPRQFGPYFGCPEGTPASCGSRDLTVNFMNFVNDECMYLFTKGQSNRMHATLILARKNLFSNTPCGEEPIGMSDSRATVFPNPVHGGFIIVRFTDEIDFMKQISLYDGLGRLVLEHHPERGDWAQLYVQDLPGGTYLMVVQTQSNRYTIKVLKL